ncbi:hypothetical protein V2J09_009910 [Rumex salicifolius]
MPKSGSKESATGRWQWENAVAGAVAGFATVAAMHPLDVVRTRFAVNDGRSSSLPTYKNTPHAILTIARFEGLRGLYAGLLPSCLGSSVSWGLYFFFYGRAKERYARNRDEKLSPALHLASAAEAGALIKTLQRSFPIILYSLEGRDKEKGFSSDATSDEKVSMCTNPIWLVKTRLQLQNPLHQTHQYTGFYEYSTMVSSIILYCIRNLMRKYDAFRTIMKEEGWTALYRGIIPSLFLVSHGAVQFTAYEELRKAIVDIKSGGNRNAGADAVLNSIDYAMLGGVSKVAAILVTYPFQVIRARLQQRPSKDGIPRYTDSWHVIRETAKYEGVRGLYKGITPSLLKNVPASSITFIVYENVLKSLKLFRTE